MASVHDKLERVRKPRVHIKYEVETEGAQIEKELPFVVGVMGDFAGDPTQEPKPFGERKFTQIDRDNFDEVMRKIAPGLNLRVENTIEGEGEMAVQLKFEKMDDFDPAAVVRQVPALAKMLEARNELRDLLSKADRSEDLEVLLERILSDQSELKQLADELKTREAGEEKG